MFCYTKGGTMFNKKIPPKRINHPSLMRDVVPPLTASDFLHDWKNANIEKRKLKEEIAVLRKKLNEKGKA